MSILQLDFQFPERKLSEMSPAEREQLAVDIARHRQTAAGRPVETNPSEVIDPQSPEGRAMYERKRQRVVRTYTEGAAGSNGYRFDPQLGYVIDEEDQRLIARNVHDAAAAERLLQPGPKEADPEAIRLHELDQMDSADRDAEERFSDI